MEVFPLRSGDMLVEMLIGYGVRHVFGLPGGQTYPLYDAIHKRPSQVRHVLTRDERTAAHAADAYARVSGCVGVCDATVGPGAAQMPAGIAEAYGSSTAVVALIGDVATDSLNVADRGCAAQGMDQLPIFQSITKWRMRVDTKAHFPQIVRQAFAHATAGRPGPALLSMPEDILIQSWTEEDPQHYVNPLHGRFPASRPCPSPADVELAAKVLVGARRPVIVAGGGVVISAAYEELKALAEHLSIPVATTVAGRGSIADHHPLAVGVVGNQYGSEAANQVEREADVVFLVGCKSSQLSSFRWTVPSPTQKVIHLDVDGTEIGKVFHTEAGLVGDARAGLASLLDAVKERKPAPVEPAEWVRRAQELKAAWVEELESEAEGSATPIKPQYLMTELRERMKPEDLLVTDASQSIGWAVNYLPVRRAGRFQLFPRGSAILGFGLPAAIGARLGHQKGKVVVVAGDGGFAYAAQELSTLAKYGLDIVVVVLNNAALGLNRIGMYLEERQNFQDLEFAPADYSLVAEAFGCKGIRVEQPGQLPEALGRAFAMEGPVLVDVVVDGWVTPDVELRQRLKGRLPAAGAGRSRSSVY